MNVSEERLSESLRRVETTKTDAKKLLEREIVIVMESGGGYNSTLDVVGPHKVVLSKLSAALVWMYSEYVFVSYRDRVVPSAVGSIVAAGSSSHRRADIQSAPSPCHRSAPRNCSTQ